jgi:hypothetical protein
VRSLTRSGTTAALLLAATVTNAAAQAPVAPAPPGGRRATTVAALAAFPVFFHGQTVRVRGMLEDRDDRRTALANAGASVIVTGPALTDRPGDPSVPVEVTGPFLDVGRLEPADPRLARVDLTTVWRQEGRTWPAPGELTLVVAEQVTAADPFAAPGIRALALDPWRYADRDVTVTGRFRGLNLYADLPQSPARDRWIFVLQSADAAVLVTGLRPKGDGFNLDPNARVDTGRFLEVSGTVSVIKGLPVIEGRRVALAKPPDDALAAPVVRVPVVGPPPEVVFSLPAAGETDVPPASTVRIQFSRDVDPATIKGHVQARLAAEPATPARPAAEEAALEFTTHYNGGLRVLELRFAAPLEPGRQVRVQLGDGIRARDGVALVPWSLAFTVGG